MVCVLCLMNPFVLLLNQQPADCRILIEKLKACSDEQLLVELQHIKTWNIGKVSSKEKADNISVTTVIQLIIQNIVDVKCGTYLRLYLH